MPAVTDLSRMHPPDSSPKGPTPFGSPQSMYRLLGLGDFTNDLQTIGAAAQERMQALLACRETLPPGEFERRAAEIRWAEQTLCNPTMKAAYDQTLSAAAHPPFGQPHAARDQRGDMDEPRGGLCPKCGWRNPRESEYCGGCGHALWEPCLSCGATVGAWEKFCGGCGANLGAVFQERSVEIRQKEQRGAALAKAGRLEEATEVLEQAAAVHHPRLADVAERSRRMLQQLAAEIQRRDHAWKGAWETAMEKRAAADFAGAKESLLTIPSERRSAAVVDMLRDCDEKLKEIADLRDEIRAGLSQPYPLRLLPQVRRLCELAPQDVGAAKLAAKLESLQTESSRQRCAAMTNKAAQLLKHHQYAAAVRVLEETPVEHRDAAWTRIHEQAEALNGEVRWLAEHFRSLWAYDEHAVPLLQRWSKVRPGDSAVTARLAKVLEVAAKQPSRLNVWKQPSLKTSRFGMPLAVLGEFPGLDLSSEAEESAFAGNVGRFAAAIGLGLQGLGLAEISVNLLPTDSSGWLSKLSRKPAKQKLGDSVWALDLGASSLKAVLLTFGEAPEVQEAVCIEIDSAEGGSAAAVVEQFLDEYSVDAADGVCVGFAAAELLIRSFHAPAAATGKKLDELIRHEATAQIPFPIEHVVWGHHAVDSATGGRSIQIAAAKRAAASSAVGHWAKRGVRVHLAQNNAVALHNLLAYCFPAQDDAAPVALLDVGRTGASLVIRQGPRLWTRTLSVGGDAFVKALVRDANLVQEEARQVAANPYRSRKFHAALQAFEGVREAFAGELARSLAFFEQQQGAAPTRLLCCGGGMRLCGLASYLAQTQ